MYNSSDDNNVGSLRIMNRRVHFKDFALLTFIIGKEGFDKRFFWFNIFHFNDIWVYFWKHILWSLGINWIILVVLYLIWSLWSSSPSVSPAPAAHISPGVSRNQQQDIDIQVRQINAKIGRYVFNFSEASKYYLTFIKIYF